MVAERHAQMEPRWHAALGEFTTPSCCAAARSSRLADYFDALLDDAASD